MLWQDGLLIPAKEIHLAQAKVSLLQLFFYLWIHFDILFNIYKSMKLLSMKLCSTVCSKWSNAAVFIDFISLCVLRCNLEIICIIFSILQRLHDFFRWLISGLRQDSRQNEICGSCCVLSNCGLNKIPAWYETFTPDPWVATSVPSFSLHSCDSSCPPLVLSRESIKWEMSPVCYCSQASNLAGQAINHVIKSRGWKPSILKDHGFVCLKSLPSQKSLQNTTL